MAAMKSAAGTRDYRASRRRRAGLTFTFLAVALCAVMVLSAGSGGRRGDRRYRRDPYVRSGSCHRLAAQASDAGPFVATVI